MAFYDMASTIHQSLAAGRYSMGKQSAAAAAALAAEVEIAVHRPPA
jgi:hypothetical protein